MRARAILRGILILLLLGAGCGGIVGNAGVLPYEGGAAKEATDASLPFEAEALDGTSTSDSWALEAAAAGDVSVMDSGTLSDASASDASVDAAGCRPTTCSEHG